MGRNNGYDKIFIRDLLLKCVIGINSQERKEKQEVLINIELVCDIQKACQSDKIEETVNYRTIKKAIITLVEKSSFFLIEKLAEEIARLCLSYAHVFEARVTVDKPGALRYAKSVAVEITRKKEDYD